MHAVSISQVVDILDFNDNGNYLIKRQIERYIIIRIKCTDQVVIFGGNRTIPPENYPPINSPWDNSPRQSLTRQLPG